MVRTLIVASVFALAGWSSAVAEEFRLTPMVGDVLTYEKTKNIGSWSEEKSTVVKTYVGERNGLHVFKLSTGGEQTFTSFGSLVETPGFAARMKNGQPSHNGQTAPDMSVEKRRVHEFDIYRMPAETYLGNYTRDCTVMSKTQRQFAGNTFTTLEESCTHTSTNSSGFSKDTFSFDAKTGYMLFWGRDRESTEEKLVSVKLVPRPSYSQK